MMSNCHHHLSLPPNVSLLDCHFHLQGAAFNIKDFKVLLSMLS